MFIHVIRSKIGTDLEKMTHLAESETTGQTLQVMNKMFQKSLKFMQSLVKIRELNDQKDKFEQIEVCGLVLEILTRNLEKVN